MKKIQCSLCRSVRKRRLIFVFFLLAFFVLPPSLSAGVPQQQSIYPVKGLVTDAEGVPLPGVTVRYGNTGTASGNDGHFSLRLPEATGTLTFSLIGYKTLHIPFTTDVPLFRMI